MPSNITHDKARLEVIVHDAVMLELITRRVPEAASQTFKLNAPIKLASGLAAEFVNPADALLAGYALTDGQNLASGGVTDIVLALPHVEIEANFLGNAAADNVLAAADLGGPFDLAKSATLLGASAPGWYLSDTTADVAFRMSGFPPIRKANSENSRTLAGDTNARVRAIAMFDKTLWYT